MSVEPATLPTSEAPTLGAPAVTGRRPGIRVLADLLAVSRPLHWTKSVLVVPVALLVAPRVSTAAVGRVAACTVAFILASVAVYIGNDLADRFRDRRHPVKRLRPIASGRIRITTAVLYGLSVLGLLGLTLIAWPGASAWPVLAYLALNTCYSGGLKHMPLIDAGCVATGFVLRVLAGYLAVGTPVSGWLLVAIFSLCLLLVMGKRRQELSDSGSEHRPALRGYSLELTGHLLQLAAVLTVVSFLLYLRGEAQLGPYAQPVMLISAPLALFGLSRYLQVVLMCGGAGDPVHVLLRDRAIVATALLWGSLLGAAMLLAHDPHLARRIHDIFS